MLKLKDSELSTALRIVQEAAQAEGHKPDSVDDLDVLKRRALRYAFNQQEKVASIRAAVATLDDWERECRSAPVVV